MAFLVSDYAALLTSSFYSMHQNGNVSITSSLGQSATGRFTLLKRNLYFSFYTAPYPLSTKPKTVQFLDPSGNILEELQVSYEIRYSFCGGRWTRGRDMCREKLVSQFPWERLVTLFCVAEVIRDQYSVNGTWCMGTYENFFSSRPCSGTVGCRLVGGGEWEYWNREINGAYDGLRVCAILLSSRSLS